MRNYLHVFQQIQEAGKCLEILQPSVEDLDILIDGLRPEGVILNWISGVKDLDHAKEIEQKILAWGQRYGYRQNE